MEKAIEFTSEGQRLGGIMHVPDDVPMKKTGIVFLNAGLVYRPGPFRLSVEIARVLCKAGYSSMRFDFPGVGDSEGDFGNLGIDLFSETSHTVKALDYFTQETGVEEILLIGVCTGSRNAVWSARMDSRVKSLVLLSMPVTFDRSKTPAYRLRAKHKLNKSYTLPNLYRKMKETPLWKLFLTVLPALLKARRAIRRLKQRGRRPRTNGDILENEDMIRSCDILFKEGRNVLFAYGEYDETLIKDFRTNIVDRYSSEADGKKLPFEFLIMPETNHTFWGAKHHAALADVILEWADKRDASGKIDMHASAARA